MTSPGYAGFPTRDVAVPAEVAAVVAGRPAQCVWENSEGCLTFAVGAQETRCFLKWSPTASGIDLEQEVVRLGWLAGRMPVPQVLDHGREAGGGWMLTAAVPGDNAVTARWKADPATAVRAIGGGLRALHDGVPAAECPFSWSAADRVADALERAAVRAPDPSRWHPVHQHLSPAQALDLVAQAPPVDRLVLCHGDACAPNTLLTDDGRWSGHVDLGAAGVADRWADLAVATWSTQWNYGPGWEDLLLAAYGVEPDPVRTSYYRLLWDLGP